jgi:hypothetical protein
MPDADLFDPDRWRADEGPPRTTPPPKTGKRAARPGRRDRFLKGPVPWGWLSRAMRLPGKALAVGLMLWLQRGMTGRPTVLFCLARAASEGVPTTTARRAIRELEQAGLVTIRRRPGRGLEVTLTDVDRHEQG